MTSITANDGRHADAGLESTRLWLDQIVATLPQPRQQMYDLFVARGLDSWSAALELGTGVAEVRRLRRENREAVMRAFEVTVLAAAEAALDEPWHGAPECAELHQIMAAAHHDDPLAGGRGRFVVLPAALRVSLSRHLSECIDCQDRRDNCMESWAPDLLSILDDAARSEQTVVDLPPIPGPDYGFAPGAHRRASRGGTDRKVVIRRAAVTGAGVLVALPLLAFAWPGFLNGKQRPAALSSQGVTSSSPGGSVAPSVTPTTGSDHGQPLRSTTSGHLSSLSPTATGSTAAVLPPSVYYTLPPSASPTPTPSQITSGPSPTSVPVTTSPSAAPSPTSPKPRKTSPTPTPVTSTKSSSPAPSATPTSTPPATTSPTPSATPSTPTATEASSPAPSSPDPTASAADPVPSASATS